MIGKIVSHYRIIEKLGEGGMGAVYKAEDVKLKRTVALKFISPQDAAKAEERTRFIREAQAVASLDHPNICTMYEIDDSEGRMFIAMAYIKGQTLGEKIKSGPLNIENALEIATQVADGLEEAHEKGIIHRDIKSSNIMLTEKGQAKIMDFGIAKLVERTKLTKTLTLMGTVDYMSPEQAVGGAVDRRADIWSLGVVMYEMLTGQPPFKGEYAQVVLHSILTQTIVPVTGLRSGIPLGFEAIINKCLEKEPDNRYQTVADLKADLKRLKRDMTTGKAVLTSKITPEPVTQKKILPKIVFPVGLTIIAIILVMLLSSSRNALKNWLGFKVVPKEKTLAVLPFSVIGGTDYDQAFSDGLVENLTEKLIKLEAFHSSLFVVSAHYVRKYEVKDAKEANQVLGVRLAISGDMKRIGEVIFLTLNLIDLKSQRLLDTQNITDHIANISTFQQTLILKVAEALKIKLEPLALGSLNTGDSTVPEAYEFYLQAQGYLLQSAKEENFDKAIKLFERAIERDSSYALAYKGLGQAYWQKYKLTKIPKWAEEARSSLLSAVQINDQLASPHTFLGIMYCGTGRYEDGIKEYQRALEIDPKNFEAKIELAMAYEELGKAEEAEETYREAIRLSQKSWIGYGNLGYFYNFQGRFQEAAKMFRKVIELAPGNIRGYINLGVTYSNLGESGQAEAAFKKSLSIKPNVDACSNLGYIYYFQGRYADAMKMNEDAIKLGKNDWIAWGNLADSYRLTPGYSEMAREAYGQAIKLVEEQLATEPNNAYNHSSLAVYLAKSGDHKKGLSETAEAQKLKPNDLTIHLQSVQVFELVGQRPQALSALQEYIELGGPLEEILRDPDLSRLRADARYKDIIKKVDTRSKSPR